MQCWFSCVAGEFKAPGQETHLNPHPSRHTHHLCIAFHDIKGFISSLQEMVADNLENNRAAELMMKCVFQGAAIQQQKENHGELCKRSWTNCNKSV